MAQMWRTSPGPVRLASTRVWCGSQCQPAGAGQVRARPERLAARWGSGRTVVVVLHVEGAGGAAPRLHPDRRLECRKGVAVAVAVDRRRLAARRRQRRQHERKHGWGAGLVRPGGLKKGCALGANLLPVSANVKQS